MMRMRVGCVYFMPSFLDCGVIVRTGVTLVRWYSGPNRNPQKSISDRTLQTVLGRRRPPESACSDPSLYQMTCCTDNWFLRRPGSAGVWASPCPVQMIRPQRRDVPPPERLGGDVPLVHALQPSAVPMGPNISWLSEAPLLGPDQPIFLMTPAAQAVSGFFVWTALLLTCHQVLLSSGFSLRSCPFLGSRDARGGCRLLGNIPVSKTEHERKNSPRSFHFDVVFLNSYTNSWNHSTLPCFGV